MPIPKIQVFIDFDRDGVFETDASEDVSSDVRRLDVTMGKNLQKRRAEAALLNMYLNNDDHKYSPSQSTSALYPNTKPGPNVWLMMHYPYDHFDASNGTTLASRKPPYDDTFAAWAGDTGDFEVSSNKLIPKNTGNKTAVLDFGESDCYIGANFTKGGTTSGLVFRWSDADNYLIIRHDGTNFKLSRVSSGTLSDISGTDAFAWAVGETHHIIVECHGDYINVSLDHILHLVQHTTFNNTATKHGVGGRATSSGDKWDDFGGTRPKFFGRADTIQPRPEINRQYCYIRAFGEMERLSQHETYRSAPVGGLATHPDDTLKEILDAVDFSTANRIHDEGTNLNSDAEHEKALTRNGLAELYQLADDDVAFFYIDGSGISRYEGGGDTHGGFDTGDDELDHRQKAPHMLSLKTWRADRLAEDETDIEVGQHFKWDDGKGNVENEIYYQYHRISRTLLSQVWRLETDDRPLIANGQDQQFLAIGDESHIANPRPPKHSTDFSFNTALDGTGTDLLVAGDTQQGTVTLSGTSAFTIDDTAQDFTAWNKGNHVIWMTDAGGDFAYAFIGTDDPDGNGTKVTLYTTDARTIPGYAYTAPSWTEGDAQTYNIYDVWVELVDGFDGNFSLVKIHNGAATGEDGYITFLRIMADKGVKSSKTAARAESNESQRENGRRRIEHETLHIDRFGGMDSIGFPNDVGSALERANKRLALRSTPQERITCRMMNLTQANLMQIVHRSISDRITLVYTPMGIDREYYIERQILTISDGGLKIMCDWELNAAVFGTWSNGLKWGECKWK